MTIYTFFEYFIAFMFYSFIGWSIEVILTLIEKKKFVDRGFLIGPYCPIYGYGMLLIVFLLRNYTENPLVLFILAIVICLVLEYLTSYFMELIFKARWWDYSDKKYNINGRVCLEYAVFFGIGGCIVMYLVHPLVINIVSNFNDLILLVVGIILLLIYIIDTALSLDTIFKVNGIEFIEYVDNTEEISKRVSEYLRKYSKLAKRLANAFPNLRIRIRNINDNVKK